MILGSRNKRWRKWGKNLWSTRKSWKNRSKI